VSPDAGSISDRYLIVGTIAIADGKRVGIAIDYDTFKL
jgi:hypothetical protein